LEELLDKEKGNGTFYEGNVQEVYFFQRKKNRQKEETKPRRINGSPSYFIKRIKFIAIIREIVQKKGCRTGIKRTAHNERINKE
jgi:hypothetical protein